MIGKKYFLNVTKGAFIEKPTPGQTSESFDAVTGRLVNIAFKETAYGPAMRLHVVSESNFYMLSMFVQSRPANAFFLLAKNLQPQYEMTFRMKSIDGKDYFSIHQFGGPVLWFYTKENQDELPENVEDKRAFFVDMIQTEFAPALHKIVNPYPNHALYKPMRQGLQGGYFDAYKSDARTPGPMSDTEKQQTGRA